MCSFVQVTLAEDSMEWAAGGAGGSEGEVDGTASGGWEEGVGAGPSRKTRGPPPRPSLSLKPGE